VCVCFDRGADLGRKFDGLHVPLYLAQRAPPAPVCVCVCVCAPPVGMYVCNG
jgi:hypothetical protein